MMDGEGGSYAGGEMGRRVREFDWSRTSVGAPETWPQSLRTALDICLGSGFPSLLWWGPDLVQFYNDAAIAILGGKHPGALGLPARDAWGAVWPTLGPLFHQVLRTGAPIVAKDLGMAPDRGGPVEEAYFTFCYHAVHGEDGPVAAVAATAIETTEKVRAETALRELERRRAQEALRASEERYRLIVEGARDYAILTTDLEGCVESWSPGAEAVYGWSADEITGRKVDVTFVPEDIQKGVPEMERAQAREQGWAPDVRWHQRKDGRRVFIDGVNRLLHGPGGEARAFLKVGQDVTERRRTEEVLRELNETLEQRVEERATQLREHEERLSTMVQTAALVVWAADADGRVVEDSPSWRALTGQSREEWLANRWTDAAHPDDRAAAAEAWAAAVRAGAPLDTEFRIRHAASGTWRWTNVRAVPLRGTDGAVRGWIGLNIDIGERKRAEEERNAVLRQLVAAEEKERLRLSRELHDQMGQLVTALLLGLKTLSPRPGAVADLERLAEQIAKEVHQVASVLRPPALDRLGLRRALQAHLEEWSARYRVPADFHALGLNAERFPPEIETTLFRAVQEGLTNAAKHAAATQVSLVLERRQGTVGIILEDNGRGFDVERSAEEASGAGRLGLLGMRERVELLGGTMEIESAPGGGTTLFVRLPDRLEPRGPASQEGDR